MPYTIRSGFDFYISPEGSDETGAGTIRNPWKTIGRCPEKSRIGMLPGIYSQDAYGTTNLGTYHGVHNLMRYAPGVLQGDSKQPQKYPTVPQELINTQSSWSSKLDSESQCTLVSQVEPGTAIIEMRNLASRDYPLIAGWGNGTPVIFQDIVIDADRKKIYSYSSSYLRWPGRGVAFLRCSFLEQGSYSLMYENGYSPDHYPQPLYLNSIFTGNRLNNYSGSAVVRVHEEYQNLYMRLQNEIILDSMVGASLEVQNDKVEVKLGTEETNYLFKEDNKFKYIEADLPIPGYETMTWTNTEDYIHNDVLIPEYYSFTELEDELFNYVTQQMKQSFDSMQYETHLDYYNSSEFDTIIQNLPKDKFISQIEVTNNGDNLRFTVQNGKVINLNVKNKIPVVTNDVHVEGSGTEEDQIRVKADSINDALQSKGVSEIQYKSTRDYAHINKDLTQLSIEGDHNILMRSWGGEHLALTTRIPIIDLILNFNGYLNVNERAQNPWDPNNLIWSVRSGSGSRWGYPTTVTNNMSASELLEYGLTPLPVPNSGTQYGRKTPWYSRLTGLDGSRVYYLKFTSTNTRIGEFSLGSHNMTQGEQQVTGPARYHHYTWGYYSQGKSSFPNSFYTNKGTQFNISTLNIQALLSIEKQLFIAWPQNISFEDFYYHHLLGMPKGSY